MSLFKELKRRNVFRVAAAYLVIGWLLAQVSVTLESALNLPNWFDSVIVSTLLIGFPITILFSWAFELTPEGIKKEKSVEPDASITHQTAKKLDYITLAAAVGVFALIGWQQMNPPSGIQTSQRVTKSDTHETTPVTAAATDASPNNMPNKTSIAVLPFADLSPNGDQEYFADGISEEILNALVKATGLRVAGRTSSFSFKGKDSTIKQIGNALSVAHVLEGSVRKQGNQVRITAQLIKANDEFHLWSETYDGSLDNIFELQEDISRKVTQELKVLLNLNPDERLASKMTNNIDAYDLFLRGRDHVGKRVGDNIPKGIALLEQAVILDPEFAEAWAILAEAEMVISGYAEADVASSDARAKRHAEKAIQLNERLALPHAVLASLTASEKNYIKAIEEFETALELEPENPIVLRWLGNTYSFAALHDKAQAFYEKAFALNPLSTADAFNLGAINFKLHNYSEAIRFYQLSGELRSAKLLMPAFIYSHQGQRQLAIDDFMEAHQQSLERNGAAELATTEEAKILALGALNGSPKQKATARKLGIIFFSESDDLQYWQLTLLVAIENFDRAFEILNNKKEYFLHFAADDMWIPTASAKKFRADPRFIQLLEHHKIPDLWREVGWPELCQPNPGTDGSNGQFRCD